MRKLVSIVALIAMCLLAIPSLQAQEVRLPRFAHDELFILLTQENFIPHLRKWKNPDKVYTITSEEGNEYHVYEYSDKEKNPKILQKFEAIRLYFGVDPYYNFGGKDYWRLLAMEFVKPPMPERYITQFAEKQLGKTSRLKLPFSTFFSVWYVPDEQILLLEKRGKKVKKAWVLWHTAVDLIKGKKVRKSIRKLYSEVEVKENAETIDGSCCWSVSYSCRYDGFCRANGEISL